MKSLRVALGVLALLAFSAFADEALYDFYFADAGIPFTYVRISAFTDGSYKPISEDGSWYNGFQDAAGYESWNLSKGPFTSYSGLVIGSYAMDPSNKSGYTFVMELLSEDKEVVGYSSYTDYATIQNAEQGSEHYGRWGIGSMTAAPVPEPTSGVLLLIGGALLGLRRKRRV